MKSLSELLPAIHEVDRTATQIWFRFYPLALHEFLKTAEDKEKTLQKFVMQGDWDSTTKLIRRTNFFTDTVFGRKLKTRLKNAPHLLANENAFDQMKSKKSPKPPRTNSKTDVSLLIGITAVGLMTLRQVGFDAFKNAEGKDLY